MTEPATIEPVAAAAMTGSEVAAEKVRTLAWPDACTLSTTPGSNWLRTAEVTAALSASTTSLASDSLVAVEPVSEDRLGGELMSTSVSAR